MRKSSRARCPPVEFWNFEEPDYSKSYNITYSISLLTSFNRSASHGETSQLKAVNRTKGANSSQLPRGRKPKDDLSNVTYDKGLFNSASVKNKSLAANCNVSVVPEKEQKSQSKRPSKRYPVSKREDICTKKVQLSENEGNIYEKPPSSTVAESYDSGITDLDGSQEQEALGQRTVETVADISNIPIDPQFPRSAAQPLDSSVLSELSRNNSYAVNRKPPNFKGVLSSTVVSEGDISHTTAKPAASNSSCFKVPRYVPRFQKKSILVEPTLDSIAEERENLPLKASSVTLLSEAEDSTFITPTKSNTVIRSRVLDLTGTNIAEGQQNSSHSRGNPPVKKKCTRGGAKSLLGFNSVSGIGDVTDGVSVTTQNMTAPVGGLRRSSRPQIRRLEFWNFERAEVTTLNNGEASVIYTKQTNPGDMSRVTETKKQQSKVSRAPKRKCATDCSKLDSTASTTEPLGKRRRGQKSAGLPVVESVEYTQMNFYPWVTEEFKCYLARSYCSSKHFMYAGFLFLEEGQLIWTTTKDTTAYVISGDGILSVLDSSERFLMVLEENTKVFLPTGKKLKLEKGDSEKLLKLFLVLQKN